MRRFSLIFKQFSRSVLLIAGFALLASSARADGDAAKGEALFKAKCTACHSITTRMTGPALGPIMTSETDDKWLYKWVQNNQDLIDSHDKKAVDIYNQYKTSMTVFTELSDGDVANIITYVRTTYKDELTKQKNAPPTAVETGTSHLVLWALIALVVASIVVILVLNRAIGTMETVLVKNEGAFAEQLAGTEADRFATLKKYAKNKKLVFFVLLCGTLALGSWTWMTMWNTNVHQGYQPVQPIKFPHDLHAGAMQINCQYCHSGAYKSKNASIPSLNVCMNCHKTVKTESPEIQKIYAALGYDPSTAKYDSTKAKPMQWIRIHNLPDLVYFNHSQHVVAGKIKCQTCHGQIQEMKEVYQYSPLTMKWCIQCHKRTKVDFKNNEYYTKMEAVHNLLKEGKPVTVAMMGGIECGKCHY